MTGDITELVLKLHDIEAVKFGSFILKSGIESPVYFDLRVIVSFPKIMCQVADCMWDTVHGAGCQFDSICGVPYTALPIATCVAAKQNVPMLIRRKEAKDYGTKKMIEGRYKRGDCCLILEDVVTSGSSVLETVESLSQVGLVVRDAVVLLDRQQGGSQRLTDNNVNLHCVCSMTRLLEILLENNRIEQQVVDQVKSFIEANNTYTMDLTKASLEAKRQKIAQKRLSYGDRAALSAHPLTARLFTIMEQKKTNLAFAADVTSATQLLQLADCVGPCICVLKTHIDILEDFTDEVVHQLLQLALKHNFLIFEDRKFADIGNTVKHQYSAGLYKISDWADMVNAHALPGPGIVQGLKEVGGHNSKGCLLIAEMSSDGNLAKGDYTAEVVKMAEMHKDFVVGFICQSRLSTDPGFVHMTPGVSLSSSGDALGQQYLSPQDVITRRGSDIIIVGRGILKAPEPAQAAKEYQEAGYAAYQACFQ